MTGCDSADFLQERVENVLLFHPLDVLLAQVIHLAQREQKLVQQFELVPQAHAAPGPGKRHPDIAIGQPYLGAGRLGRLHRGDHFLARFDVHAIGNPLLKTGQNQIRQQQKGFFLFDHLDDVHFLPTGLLADGLQP